MSGITVTSTQVNYTSNLGLQSKGVHIGLDRNGEVARVGIRGFDRFTRDQDVASVTRQELNCDPKLRNAVESALQLAQAGPEREAEATAAFKAVYDIIDLD